MALGGPFQNRLQKRLILSSLQLGMLHRVELQGCFCRIQAVENGAYKLQCCISSSFRSLAQLLTQHSQGKMRQTNHKSQPTPAVEVQPLKQLNLHAALLLP
eukprot:2557416-Amphidinium_carterae.1